jgi:hypothetical protein
VSQAWSLGCHQSDHWRYTRLFPHVKVPLQRPPSVSITKPRPSLSPNKGKWDSPRPHFVYICALRSRAGRGALVDEEALVLKPTSQEASVVTST